MAGASVALARCSVRSVRRCAMSNTRVCCTHSTTCEHSIALSVARLPSTSSSLNARSDAAPHGSVCASHSFITSARLPGSSPAVHCTYARRLAASNRTRTRPPCQSLASPDPPTERGEDASASASPRHGSDDLPALPIGPSPGTSSAGTSNHSDWPAMSSRRAAVSSGCDPTAHKTNKRAA